MIFVKSADGYRTKLRGLLDNASTICVMREDIARKLGFKFRSANQSITGINGITQASKYSAKIEISNRDYTFARNVQFSLLPKITDAIPVSKLNISDLNIPASIELADSNFHMPGQIDILIRSRYVDPNQRDLQRIMWKTSADTPIKTYKLGTVTYGTVSAPFLATRTLKALADEESRCDFNDSYMNDILSGESTLEGVKKLQTRLSQLLQRGGLSYTNGCQIAQNC
ncbi:DUF1758 domain-containing protein [Trichonephila clavipes]|nr:DUF1758 domain-containing protein [Trichonephila clavipes]